MWKCKNCWSENVDSTTHCVSCGERKAANSTKESAAAPTSKITNPSDRFCYQAQSLESWGSTVWIITILTAIIVFIASGYSFEIDRWGNSEIVFHFTSLIRGIIPAVCWIGGGYSFKLIVEAFAIVVEAAYRNLMASGKSPN